MESGLRSRALAGDWTEGDGSPASGGSRGRPGARVAPGLLARAIGRAQAGDRQALGFLYARYADDIHDYVRSIVRDADEAEVLTRQVFAKLIAAIGTYDEREVSFSTWVLRVARGVAVDHVGRRRSIPVERARVEDTDPRRQSALSYG